MRTCVTCGEEHPEDQFEQRDGRFRNQCRLCRNKRQTVWFKTERGKKIKAQVDERYKGRLREYVNDQKREQGCQVCRQEWEPVALDYHHSDPTQKDLAISTLIGNQTGYARLKAEMDKCICVCANCHRKIHAGLIDLAALGLVA